MSMSVPVKFIAIPACFQGVACESAKATQDAQAGVGGERGAVDEDSAKTAASSAPTPPSKEGFKAEGVAVDMPAKGVKQDAGQTSEKLMAEADENPIAKGTEDAMEGIEASCEYAKKDDYNASDMDVDVQPGGAGNCPSKNSRGLGTEVPPPQDELEDTLDVKVGAKCTSYDSRDGKWYKCVIVELKGTEAKVHYEGWKKTFDAWVEVGNLKPPVKKHEAKTMPAPGSLRIKSTALRSVTLEASISPEAAKVQEISVQSVPVEDNEPTFETKVKSASIDFDSTFSTFSFECKGLMPNKEYEIAVKVNARNFKWSAYSDCVRVKTDGEDVDHDTRKAKELAGQKSKQQAGLHMKQKVELSEQEAKARSDKLKTKHHDQHCDLCLAVEGQLFFCNGGCKRAFHADCVNVDADDIDTEKWVCQMCEMDRVRCCVCSDACEAERAVFCSRDSCKKAFHPACLASYIKKPISEVQSAGKFVCPRHECNGCGKNQSEYTGKQGQMIRCIRCPVSYHFKCIPSHGYVEYPEPFPYIICEKHVHEVRKFKELEVKAALNESKIEPFDTAGVKNPVIKHLMDKLQLTLPHAFKVPARFAEARNYQGNKPEPFKLLRSNLYTMGKPKMSKEDIEICECKATDKRVCTSLPASVSDAVVKNGGGTCGDFCENRQTMFECLGSVCHADCQNQRLQKRQYARAQLFKTTDGRGWGLKALEDVPAGSLVQEYIGEVLTTDAFTSRAASYGPNKPVYFFNINSEMVIDASAMGSMARFINHSCDPNCHTEKWSVGAETRIAIVANDFIPAGAEFTYNYEFESFGTMEHKCMCGAANCSGYLGKRPKSAKELAKEEKERMEAKKKKRRRKSGGSQPREAEAPPTESKETATGQEPDATMEDAGAASKGSVAGADNESKGSAAEPVEEKL
jgi:hypothetical protein